MAIYSQDQVRELLREFPRIHAGLAGVYGKSIVFGQSRLANDEAKKYMLRGVARRLGLIRHCTERIFEVFPPGQTAPLRRELLEDVNINLHAFVLHGNAIQDNLAWALIHEFGWDAGRYDASLFRPALQRRLPAAVQEYLQLESVEHWRVQYSTDFRDALAHRIPLYVPPSQLTREEGARAVELQNEFNESVNRGDWESVIAAQDQINALGRACPYYLHEGTAHQIILHPQILSDGLTVTELVNVVLDNWPERTAD